MEACYDQTETASASTISSSPQHVALNVAANYLHLWIETGHNGTSLAVSVACLMLESVCVWGEGEGGVDNRPVCITADLRSDVAQAGDL